MYYAGDLSSRWSIVMLPHNSPGRLECGYHAQTANDLLDMDVFTCGCKLWSIKYPTALNSKIHTLKPGNYSCACNIWPLHCKTTLFLRLSFWNIIYDIHNVHICIMKPSAICDHFYSDLMVVTSILFASFTMKCIKLAYS